MVCRIFTSMATAAATSCLSYWQGTQRSVASVERCILSGNFPRVHTIGLCNNGMARLLVTSGSFPLLDTFDLRANRFRDALNLTGFPAVRVVNLDGNLAPPRDKGGKPFRLRVIVTPKKVDGAPETRRLEGDNLRLVYDDKVPTNHLAPAELAENEVNGDTLGAWSSEDEYW